MTDLSFAQDLAQFELVDTLPGNNVVPQSEFPGNAWGVSGLGLKAKNQRVMYSPGDFDNGNYPPYYINETDVARNRAECRNLAQFTSTMVGATTSLTNYVVHTGFSFEVTPKKEYSSPEIEELASDLQELLDEFFEENDFIGDKDRAAHSMATDEGEYILGLFPKKDGSLIAKEIPNDCLTEPHDKEGITNWLIKSGQIEKGTYDWSYGVLTKFDEEMQDFDPSPIGYHVMFDNAGTRWKYLPAERVMHIKLNTIESAKRGVSDWYPILEDVRKELKLRGNTATSGIFNAAIIGIRSHSAKTTRDQVQTLQSRLANADRIREGKQGGSTSQQASINDAPHVADISNGMEWQAGPMGSLNHPVFVEIIQMVLKAIGRRWNMPEYLISQDASNANYASTLVSEDPFVKTVETRQAHLIKEFTKLAFKIIALKKGLDPTSPFNKYSAKFLKRVLTLNVEAPDIVSREPDKNTTRLESLHNARVLSKRSWASKEGLDYDEEEANFEQEPDDFAQSFNEEVEKADNTLY